jgi:hypothetical protein
MPQLPAPRMWGGKNFEGAALCSAQCRRVGAKQAAWPLAASHHCQCSFLPVCHCTSCGEPSSTSRPHGRWLEAASHSVSAHRCHTPQSVASPHNSPQKRRIRCCQGYACCEWALRAAISQRRLHAHRRHVLPFTHATAHMLNMSLWLLALGCVFTAAVAAQDQAWLSSACQAASG